MSELGTPPGRPFQHPRVTEAVTPFLLMVSLPHGVLQVANKRILEVTGLNIVQTTVLCQAHEIRASYSQKGAA